MRAGGILSLVSATCATGRAATILSVMLSKIIPQMSAEGCGGRRGAAGTAHVGVGPSFHPWPQGHRSGPEGRPALRTLGLHLPPFCWGLVRGARCLLKGAVGSSWQPGRGLISAHILPLLSHANEFTTSLLLCGEAHALPSTL